ncbi:MAG TPA: trypsin-like peptidase domain-containing protein [Candidatus Polarisedimenticolia bacterium]|nr:trypsin-like peptidase domain-containing protein [Candidatus Polarisedimenticolia bacterium]
MDGRLFAAVLPAVFAALANLSATEAPEIGPGAAGLERSVVRIVNHTQRADWSTPWDASKVVEVSGSGFVIEGGLVMTNAHVVSDSRLLLIHVEGTPAAQQAEVVHVGHDCDLALIRPLDAAALDDAPPLPFGALPPLGSSVDTLGYPTGGVRVSSTRGVVSRIEEQVYVHSGIDQHIAVQTDAAINPGSSGGPVLRDGHVVGVAFQNNLSLENVGYFIPTEVIARFLKDVSDGSYDGYPDLGFDTATLEQPAARARAGMRKSETGVRVFRVYRGSSSEGRIRVGDVILAVNGRAVANDGSVLEDARRIPYGLLIDRMFIEDLARLRVLRDGNRLELEIPLQRHPLSVSRRKAYGLKPRYFVHGGLVFVPLSRETFSIYGADWRRGAPRTLLDDFFHRPLVEPDMQLRERVVLLRRLDDPVNAEMAWYLEQVVERVNGKEIVDLQALVDAFERHEGDYHLIEFAHAGRFSVLDRRKAAAANAGILQRYGVHEDRNL